MSPSFIILESFKSMINSDRVKVVIMFNGDSVLADVQEAVDKESGARQAYILNYPYKVTYSSPELDGTGIVEDPEVKVHYQPWCPLSAKTYARPLSVPVEPSSVALMTTMSSATATPMPKKRTNASSRSWPHTPAKTKRPHPSRRAIFARFRGMRPPTAERRKNYLLFSSFSF